MIVTMIVIVIGAGRHSCSRCSASYARTGQGLPGWEKAAAGRDEPAVAEDRRADPARGMAARRVTDYQSTTDPSFSS